MIERLLKRPMPTGLPERYEHPAVDRDEVHITRDTASGPVWKAWSRLPAIVQVLFVYVLSRLVTTAIMLVYAGKQEVTWQTPQAYPDLFTFSNLWDAEWYGRIVANLYPSELPVNEQGLVTENAWAFMPVYPLLVRGLMAITGLPFSVLTVCVSVVAGFGCAYGLYQLLVKFTNHNTALFAVVLLCFGPISPLFQVGYAEALHFWMLTALLRMLVARQWYAMLPLIAVASFTRPTGLAWAFTLFLYICYRYWNCYRMEREAFPKREQIAAWVAAVFSGIMGLAWLVIAGIVTGMPRAYLETEYAWRRHYTGDTHTLPFTPWFFGADFWFGQPLGTIVVFAILIAVAAWLTSRVLNRFGIEIRLWAIAYFVYIFAVFFPQSSTFRMVMPMFPAAVAPLALPRSPVYRVSAVLVSIIAQAVWIHWMWFVIGYDWTPP